METVRGGVVFEGGGVEEEVFELRQTKVLKVPRLNGACTHVSTRNIAPQ